MSIRIQKYSSLGQAEACTQRKVRWIRSSPSFTSLYNLSNDNNIYFISFTF